MKAQIPAKNIKLDNEFDDALFYTVSCNCGNEDHNIKFYIEIDEEFNEIQVNSYFRQTTDWYKDLIKWDIYSLKFDYLYNLLYNVKYIINGILHRLKITKNVWINGYVEYYSNVIMDKQTAINYAQAIINGIKKLEKKK